MDPEEGARVLKFGHPEAIIILAMLIILFLIWKRPGKKR
jgi:hypothetical protein